MIRLFRQCRSERLSNGYPPAALRRRNEETVTTEICAFNCFQRRYQTLRPPSITRFCPVM